MSVGDVTSKVSQFKTNDDHGAFSVGGITGDEFSKLQVACRSLSAGDWQALQGKISPALYAGLSSGSYQTYYQQAVESGVAYRKTNTPESAQALTDIGKDPDAFVKQCTQVDGNAKTVDDRHICVPAAILVGIVAYDATALQRIGAGLKAKGIDATFPNIKDPAQKAALQKAADDFTAGKATPDDVRQLALALYTNRAPRFDKDTGKQIDGSSAVDATSFYATLRTLAGGNIAPISLGMFQPASGGEGHCIVSVAGRAYSTWPDGNGQTRIAETGQGMALGQLSGTLTFSLNLDSSGGEVRQWAYAGVTRNADGKTDPFMKATLSFDANGGKMRLTAKPDVHQVSLDKDVRQKLSDENTKTDKLMTTDDLEKGLSDGTIESFSR